LIKSEILGVLSLIAFLSEIFEQRKEASEEAREKMFADWNRKQKNKNAIPDVVFVPSAT